MPTEYYLTNQTTASADEMERIIINRGSSHKLKFDVVEVDSMLMWEFVSTDYDINFGVSHLNNGRKVEVVRTRLHDLVTTHQFVWGLFFSIENKSEQNQANESIMCHTEMVNCRCTRPLHSNLQPGK